MLNVFNTTDSDLAVYLTSEGYVLLRTDISDSGTVFTFSDDAKLIADAYYDGVAVSAKRFLFSLHKLGVLRRELTNGNTGIFCSQGN